MLDAIPPHYHFGCPRGKPAKAFVIEKAWMGYG